VTRIVIDEKILDDTLTAIGRLVDRVCTHKIIFDDGNTAPVGDFIKLNALILEAITESKDHAQKLLELQHACMDGMDITDVPNPCPMCAGTGVADAMMAERSRT